MHDQHVEFPYLDHKRCGFVPPGVAIMHSEFLQLAGHVIRRSGVKIPVGINTVGSTRGVGRFSFAAATTTTTTADATALTLGRGVEGFVEALETAPGRMPFLLADLALHISPSS